jgi:putative tryptophan/tyrosine transport system substrate-binding protein
MKRRDAVLAPLVLVAATLARTQVPGRTYRVGYFGFTATNSAADLVVWNSFVHRLRELGYNRGSNLIIEDRYAEGRLERYADFAAEMVRLKADVVVATSGNAATAVMAVSRSMPIVIMFAPQDPVRAGLVASLARPGGQLTGMTTLGGELVPKHLELLKAALPSVTRIGYAWCPRCAVESGYSEAEAAGLLNARVAAGRSLGVTVVPVDVNSAADFDAATAQLLRERVGALLVGSTPINAALRERWNTFSAQHQVPRMSEQSGTGAMFSYGADGAGIWRRAAEFVAKILGGAAPGELPMEQPTIFNFVINLKMAKAMGVTIPQSVLLRATEVIE